MENEDFLTRKECTAMKGIAILGIMLHNYCHWLTGIVRENEYNWQMWKTDRLWTVLCNTDDLLPMHLISFFGHYGVPVFLFLSGYGLVMKYENSRNLKKRQIQPVGIWRFIRYNYLKLFRILIVGFVLFTLFDAFTPGIHRYKLSEAVAILGMYANFFEHPSEVVWPGPYWYFSVTMQLYILYRLVMYRTHWVFAVLLILVCWMWQEFFLDDNVLLERLRYNFVGGMLPFGVGVLVGHWSMSSALHWSLTDKQQLWLKILTLVVSIGLTLLMSFYAQAWLWIPVFIITGTIALVKLIPKQVFPYVVWLGTISAAIFVTHPLVRKIFVRPYIRDDMYAGLLLYVAATILLSWYVKKLINEIACPRL